MPKKFDFAKITDVLFDNLEQVTGLPDSHVKYVGPHDITGYPYAVWQITDPHDVEQTSLSRQRQIFDVSINLNLYDKDNPARMFNMEQGISQLFFNPYFEQRLNDAGGVLANVKSNGATNNDIASANGIENQNFIITLRLSSVYYLSYKYYYRILNTNMNKPYKIKH